MAVSMHSTPEQMSIAAVTDYVAAPAFPCVGARSAFNKGRVRFASYGVLGSERNAAALCEDLRRFSAEFPDPGAEPVSFIAMFGNDSGSEARFACELWQQLQAMHEHDREHFDWDPTVSDDVSAADFSFSIAGRAFFVVGLNPASSRLARRAPMPCMVFNFHNQFETLRASGKYAGMQKVIRNRDVELQGTINPVLAQFGTASEARQYSGVAVDANWKCPFHVKEDAVAA